MSTQQLGTEDIAWCSWLVLETIYLEVLHWGWYRLTVRGHWEMWLDVVRDTGVLSGTE